MSQPDGAVATPDEAARAAQDTAAQITNEGVIEGPANTDPPPGFIDQQQPAARTAEPYYVPPPARPRQDPRYLPPQFR